MPGFELINKKEKKAVASLFDESGVLFAHGFDNLRKRYHVREFEKRVSKFFNSRYSLAVSSGTAAIKVGLKALGVKPGDEVITQVFNFIATIEAILDCGAKPILINSDETFNMCPIELEKKITKKTKVIIPVHMLGVSAKMTEIKKIAKKRKIKILEDNCESMGGVYKKKYLGTLGDLGVFSLDFGKFITTGEGGLIISDNKKIIKYCREYHDHGHENNPKLPRGMDTKTIYGFNYRMTELQATVGKEQLKKLKLIKKIHKIKYKILEKKISHFSGCRIIPKNSEPNYDTFILTVESKTKRKKVLEILLKNKIGTKNLPDAIKWHCAYYWDHIFNKKEINSYKKTKSLLEKSIAIPIWVNKDKSIYEKIAKEISKIIL